MKEGIAMVAHMPTTDELQKAPIMELNEGDKFYAQAKAFNENVYGKIIRVLTHSVILEISEYADSDKARVLDVNSRFVISFDDLYLPRD
ncbi:MAG: hypothetical protein LBM95_08530 [Lactobacillales bacterium]|jgi:hypothetical protein|nr:hypothetical protein [Lactobacillales bacterium]